jgi:hypothetical protein
MARPPKRGADLLVAERLLVLWGDTEVIKEYAAFRKRYTAGELELLSE